MKKYSILMSVASVLIVSTAASATPITIVDPSFELNAAVDLGVVAATNWNDPTTFGVFDPQDDQFTDTTGDGVQGELVDGGQVGNLAGSTVLSQNLGVAVKGAMYTLDYFIGARRDGDTTGTHRVELLEGTNTIFSVVDSPAAFGFAAAPQHSGVATGTGTLTLRFTPLTGQNFIDSVSLDVINPAPEPSSLILAIFGVVGLVARRRRRRE